jgi:glycosyltransferase involved in cell wall biosynthesis
MAKPKLLIVGAFPSSDSSIVGGIVTTCRLLIESDFPNYFDLILIDSTQRSNPPPNFYLRLLLAIGRTYRFFLALVFKQPDAVILFTAVGASVAEKGFMAWIARLTKIPVFLFPRGAGLIDVVRKNLWQKLWIVPAMRGATHILCQGPSWQNFAINDLGYSKKSAPIIYNWSATTQLLRVGSGKIMYRNKLTTKILFLGWLEEEKGIFELLEACRELSARHTFVLTVAGRGHAEDKSKKFITKHNLESCVELVGWVHGPQMIKILESADILVLPSWAEGFPNAIIEAMAAKVAVIVTSVGNVPDMLQHRDQAMIIPPKDVGLLTDALEELIVDSDFRSQLAQRGYSYARDNFSTEKGVQLLMVTIKSAIESSLVPR